MTHTSTARPAARASGALVPVLAFVGIVVAVMQTVLVPVIKDLPRLLDTEPGNATWVITSTLLSGAVATPITGRLGDLYGKRRMLILSLAVMVAGSLVSALTSDLLSSTDRSFREQKELKRFNTFQVESLRTAQAKHNDPIQSGFESHVPDADRGRCARDDLALGRPGPLRPPPRRWPRGSCAVRGRARLLGAAQGVLPSFVACSSGFSLPRWRTTGSGASSGSRSLDVHWTDSGVVRAERPSDTRV